MILYFLIGFVSGIGSGLLGIGGGIIRIPMLIFFGGFEQIIAQGISLLTTIPTAFTAAATKIRKENNLLNLIFLPVKTPRFRCIGRMNSSSNKTLTTAEEIAS